MKQAARDAVFAKVEAASKIEDPLAFFPLFKKYDRNGLNLQIECKRVLSLNSSTVDWAYELTRDNMMYFYTQVDWVWNDKEKMEQFKDERAFYLLAYDANSTPVAFCLFRFSVDYGNEVIYCYELQLERQVQRKGLGKFLMQILQLIANRTEMRKVIVPVFRQNTGAYRFFREALQFDIDVYSPSTFSTYGNSSIHEILSRQTKFGEAVGLACYGDPCYCCD
ncbi:N-alpha-acetyltransferase 40 isoform X2 [Scleropages formosus]|nr:N-alpha-acetyltransferase 40-like isoform X2 [Scleropages formosus]